MERPPLPPKHLQIQPEDDYYELEDGGNNQPEISEPTVYEKPENTKVGFKKLVSKMFPIPDEEKLEEPVEKPEKKNLRSLFIKKEEKETDFASRPSLPVTPIENSTESSQVQEKSENLSPLESLAPSKEDFKHSALDHVNLENDNVKFEQSMIKLDKNAAIQEVLKSSDKQTVFQKYKTLKENRQKNVYIAVFVVLLACLAALLIGGIEYITKLTLDTRTFLLEEQIGKSAAQIVDFVCGLIGPLFCVWLGFFTIYSLLILVRERYIPAFFLFVISATTLSFGVVQLGQLNCLVAAICLLLGIIVVGGLRKAWKM